MDDSERYPDYRPLGFVANPFAEPARDVDYWVPQLAHAEACLLLRLVDQDAGREESKPVLLQHAETIPDFYIRPALNEFLRATALDERLDVLAFNVGLDMMRLGRIRGTLTELAELVAAADFDLTLAAYAAAILGEPDESLPEYAALAELDVPSLAERFSAAPTEAVAEHFGDLEAARKPDEDANAVLYEAYLRSSALEADPAEGEIAEEEAAVLIAEEGAADEAGVASDRAVADYVVAHARANLSPVVARAIAAYIEDGFSAVAQELKVTKAPKKTLAAVARFATHRFRKLVVIYDRFDSWPLVDDETKALVVGSLSELRWALRPTSVFAIMLPHGQAPEIEEQFAAADRVEWEFAGIEALLEQPDRLDPALVQRWLDAASLAGTSPLRAEDALLAPLFKAAGGSLRVFGELAHAAFEAAATRGASSLGAEDVAHATAAS